MPGDSVVNTEKVKKENSTKMTRLPYNIKRPGLFYP